jgi:RNA polymerase sigma-70 factor (ECF subfamily)
MVEEYENARLATFRIGDHDVFQLMTDPYRQELVVHCYRMLGSLDDAEDALQETFLRAWRRLDSLKEQASLRAWLYKIATNVSLDMLDNRKARSIPTMIYAPADPQNPLPAPINDPIWLDPLPDEYLDGLSIDPEAHVETRESVALAFLAVLQNLPGRQRAVLILRDVLGWRAQEVSELLNITAAAVNSALQRARATIKKQQTDLALYRLAAVDNTPTADLLSRYVMAWEMADSTSLIALLREDAVLTMPPSPAWYRGRNSIKAFLDGFLFAGQAKNRFRLVAARANGCPAFATYQLDENGVYRPVTLQVLTIAQGQIAQMDDFMDQSNKLFSRFKLPLMV